MKNKSKIKFIKSAFTVLTAVVFSFVLTACIWGNPTGIGDPLSNDNINQFIKKGENWRQIVEDRTPFELGEADEEPYETVNQHDAVYSDYYWSYGNFPAIDGSTVLVPMAAEFVWQFTDISDLQFNDENSPLFEYRPTSDTLTFLNFSTTSGAYNSLISGGETNGFIKKRNYDYDEGFIRHNTYHFKKRPDIVIATHPSQAELQLAAESGVQLIIEPICFDSFVFITHRDNPVDSLTVEQIRQIYSGKIKNWNKVGGQNSKITAYQREANSGSQTYMEETVMNGLTMTKAPTAKIRKGMGSLVEAVAGYENGTMSLGYTYKYYVDKLYTNPDIKILKVDGIEPSDENVRNSSYSFIAAYNAVIRSTETDGTGGNFLTWILSDEGQACINQAGYVTLKEKLDNANL